MATEWFVKRDKKQDGPFTSAQLKRLAENGEVTPDTDVRRGTDKWWFAARCVKGLFPVTKPEEELPMAEGEWVKEVRGDGPEAHQHQPKATYKREDGSSQQERQCFAWYGSQHTWFPVAARVAFVLLVFGPCALFLLCIFFPGVRGLFIRQWAAILENPEPKDVPHLVILLDENDGRYSGAHRSVMHELKMYSPNEVEREAIIALGKIGPEGRDAVPVLVQYLDDKHEYQLREEAIRALGRIGPEVRDAIPPEKREEVVQRLVKVLKTHLSKQGAVDVLGSLGPVASQSVPALIDLLKSRNPSLCLCAANALAQIAPEGHEQLALIVSSVERNCDSGEVKEQLALLLRRLNGRSADDNVDKSQQILPDPPDPRETAASLIKCLDERSNAKRLLATAALEWFVIERPAVALEFLKDDRGKLNWLVAVCVLRASERMVGDSTFTDARELILGEIRRIGNEMIEQVEDVATSQPQSTVHGHFQSPVLVLSGRHIRIFAGDHPERLKSSNPIRSIVFCSTSERVVGRYSGTSVEARSATVSVKVFSIPDRRLRAVRTFRSDPKEKVYATQGGAVDLETAAAFVGSGSAGKATANMYKWLVQNID